MPKETHSDLKIQRVAEAVIEEYLRCREKAENRSLSLLELFPIDPLGIAMMRNINVSTVAGLEGCEGTVSTRTSSIIVNDGASRSGTRSRRRFTIAHELGHTLLAHEGAVLDRVRRVKSQRRPVLEQEADKFAAAILTPASIVPRIFGWSFGKRLDRRHLTDDDAYFLSDGLRRRIGSTEFSRMSAHDFAKRIAVVESFRGRQFDSMHTKFGVSIEAMAIRLSELELVC